MVWRRLPLVLTIMVLGVLASFYLIVSSPRVYQASAVIQLLWRAQEQEEPFRMSRLASRRATYSLHVAAAHGKTALDQPLCSPIACARTAPSLCAAPIVPPTGQGNAARPESSRRGRDAVAARVQ